MLGSKVKKYREENDITQEKLGRIMGMGRTNIAQIERGKIKGTMKFVTKMAEISHTNVSYWLDDEIEKHYNTYESLDIIADALIDNGNVKEDGKITDDDLQLLRTVLEKEFKLKIKRKRKREREQG